jgi:Glycosyl hydrolase family 12
MLSRHAAPLLVLGAIAALAVSSGPVGASSARQKPGTNTICQQLGWEKVTTGQGGRYIVRNDNFGGRTECLANSGLRPNFTVTRSKANSSGPEAMAYPDVFYGCSWGLCTSKTLLPVRASRVRSATASWSIATQARGQWNAAFDIWFGRHRSAYKTQATGAELMIWLNAHDDPASPALTFTADHRRWYLYHWVARLGDKSWNYIQVRAVHKVNHVHALSLVPIIDHVERVGLIRPSWWMLNVESGFEIWTNGAGLATKSFSTHIRLSGAG